MDKDESKLELEELEAVIRNKQREKFVLKSKIRELSHRWKSEEEDDEGSEEMLEENYEEEIIGLDFGRAIRPIMRQVGVVQKEIRKCQKRANYLRQKNSLGDAFKGTYCNLCNKNYSTKQTLNQHFARIHSSIERPYPTRQKLSADEKKQNARMVFKSIS
jgi:hypothetical protein